MSFSQQRSGEAAPHNLIEVLEETLELATTDYDIKNKYDFRQIKIERDYEDNLPPALIEKTKIQQVLLNLLNNSAHAMRVRETLTSEPQLNLKLSRKGEMLSLEVTDNGTGMDKQTRKQVFEPFFTTKEVGTGVGLGLSLSYFIITKGHGGTMSVESSPGKGSTFIIELPIAGEEKQLELSDS